VTHPLIASTVDARGLVCPLPVIKLSKSIKSVPIDAIVELLATDPGSMPDLEAFEKQTGHLVVERSQDNGVFRFLVRRTK
jgi:tRNA 2-thiouridine synthesizing protein A